MSTISRVRQISWIASLSLMALARLAAEPAQGRVRVYILAGQSNMEGKAKVQLLEFQIKQPTTRDLFHHYQKDGRWVEREDVWIKFLDRRGKLTVGYGSPGCIGPELEMGHRLGNRFEAPVLLIKTAWGGRSLHRDFRSPSAGLPPRAALEKLLEEARKKKPDATLEEITTPFGASFRAMIEEVNGTLASLKDLFPEYEGQGYDVAGFVWFQGWNDMISAEATTQYASNLAHFIRDVRKDLKSPSLPFVVAQMGVEGLKASAEIERFKAAQAAILDLPELKGNVALVRTDAHWDVEAEKVFRKGWRENIEEWNKVGSDWPYHYLGSARTLCAIGKAMADAAIALGNGPEEQASALKELRDTFTADYGPNGPRDPSSFAEKLLKLARDTEQSPGRFILNREAARIAAAGGDVDLALAALNQEISAFAADGWEERRLLLSTLGQTMKGKAPSRRLAEEHLALAWANLEQDDFARAAEAAVQARKLATRAGSVVLADLAAELSKDIAEIAAEHARILKDIPLAGTAGADAKVNASVGRFLCALKGDWDRGLPLLARGLEAALTPQAESDRASPTAAADRAAVGDGWWGIAQGAQGLPRRRFEERACHWYRLALPELSGLGASRIEARLLSHELSRPDWIPRDSVLVLTCDESTLFNDARESRVRDLSDRNEAVDRKGAQLTRGKAGEGLLFDGRDDGLQCGSRSWLLAGGAFTAAAWAQPHSPNPGAAGYVVSQDDWLGDARGFVLRFAGDGTISFTVGVKTASGARWQSVAGPKVKKGEWCHAVAVFEADSMRLYVNGKLASTAKPDGPILKSPVELRIGCSDFDKARRFHGVIDEVVLVSRAVSNEEVKALFERGRKGRSLR